MPAIYGIVRNLCRAHLRRRRRFAGLDAATAAADRAPDAPMRIAGTETAAIVRRALARLPSRYRELILLCDLHDLSYAEAAVVVGASVAAVRSRLHRGRQMLRQAVAAALRTPLPRAVPARCAV